MRRLLFKYANWDWTRDDRGFGLRVWMGPLYFELFHDAPTKRFDSRLLYGEGA